MLWIVTLANAKFFAERNHSPRRGQGEGVRPMKKRMSDNFHLHDNRQTPRYHGPELLHRKLETAIPRDKDGATARTRRGDGLPFHLPQSEIGT